MDRPLTPSRQAGKLKSNMQRDMCLALVSHELRTPTNAIIGCDNSNLCSYWRAAAITPGHDKSSCSRNQIHASRWGCQ
jgi:signal transduction histidine kinase